MLALTASQTIPSLPVQYGLKQQQFCFNNPRRVSVETEYMPDSKVGQIASSVFHAALSGIGQVFSAVDRGFCWIDSFFPKASFAAAQVLPAPNQNDPQASEPINTKQTVNTPQASTPADAKYTKEEQVFLGDLEAYVELARIVPEDKRYLFAIVEMIEDYMQKNNAIAFPAHMSRAIEILSNLATWQTIVMDRVDQKVAEFEEPQRLTEDCFYQQVQDAVESAQMTTTVKERVLATRVVQLIVETYLSTNNLRLLPADVLDKFGKITDKLCGFYGRELLSKKLPYIIDDSSMVSPFTIKTPNDARKSKEEL